MNYVSDTDIEEIAKPVKATRTRATTAPDPAKFAPASPIAADESPSPTQAVHHANPKGRPPASKPSPKGARRAMHSTSPSNVTPVANIPAKAGRKARQRPLPKRFAPSALIPSQDGAAGQARRETHVRCASGNIPAQAGGRATVTLRPRVAAPVPTIPASAGASEAMLHPSPIDDTPRSQKPRREAGGIGQDAHGAQTLSADPNLSASDSSDAGQVSHATQLPLAGVVEQIVQLWRMRQRWHRAEKSLVLQGKALCRSWTNGDKTKASEMFAAAAKGKNVPPEIVIALMPFLASIERFGPERAKIEKELQKLSKSLPIWTWVANQKGFGPLNLAAIVGEAGEVGTYRNPSCLWKRMGLAVIGGERQRKKSGVEEAKAHGYNPSRRAVAYLLGDCLIKGNGEGRYRTLYLERKEIEAARDEVKTKAHAHNRAARYMTKRVLRDLWSEWRRCALSAGSGQ